jgi:hypothetical protein
MRGDEILGLLGVFAIVTWIVAAGITWYVAEQKGRDPLAWAFLSIIATPLIALIALAAIPNRRPRQLPAKRERPTQTPVEVPDDPYREFGNRSASWWMR